MKIPGWNTREVPGGQSVILGCYLPRALVATGGHLTAVLHNPETSLSTALEGVIASLQPEGNTSLRQLLEQIGEQGLLLFTVVLCIPFLFPVGPPGMSTAFGLVILLIGVGVARNRVPWLPDRLLDRPLTVASVRPVLVKGRQVCLKLERVVRPRWLQLTAGATVNVVHGSALVFAALVLMAPLPFIPLSNTLPGGSILLLALGLAERDGLLVLGGYLLLLVATVYVSGLLWGAAWAALHFLPGG